MGNYTLQQAQNDVASLRGQIAHLLATVTLGTVTVSGTLTADGSVTLASTVGGGWTDITLDSAWTAVSGYDAPRYRLLASNLLQLSGAAGLSAGRTTAANLNSSNPLPSACRPAKTHLYRNWGLTGGRFAVQIDSTGVIGGLAPGGINGTAQSAQFCEIDGIIPLD